MNYSVDGWRSRILAGWEKYGTGEPLDPKTVEHLANEFAKPLMPDPKPLFIPKSWPWNRYGVSCYNPLMFAHRTMFIDPYNASDKSCWWDGSCLETAIVKEGPRSIVLVRPS